MLTIILYESAECKLCEQTKNDLASLQTKYPHKLVEINIEDYPDLKEKYQTHIPVIEIGPYVLKAPIDKKKISMTIGAALDRITQLQTLKSEKYQKMVERGNKISTSDKFTTWFSKRYMIVFNLLVFLYVGLPVLAPVLVKHNLRTPANVIYKVYGGLCHQLAFRSWFLYGKQPVYPREAAGVKGLQTYGEATGLNEHDLWEARRFIGNEELGYKVALCERDMAIYGAILLFGIIFDLSGRKIKHLNIFLWILIGLIPIGLDGVSQLVSQMPLGLIPYRESTPLLRTLTGFLFGFATAWFGYPLVEETMRDTRSLMVKKYAKVAAYKDDDE